MPYAATEEMCARCNRHLFRNNRSPDRLCTSCQDELGYNTYEQIEFKAWLEGGKPRIVRPNPEAPVRAHKPKRKAPSNGHTMKGPDPRKLDNTYLIACMEELRRRREDARAILSALGEE